MSDYDDNDQFWTDDQENIRLHEENRKFRAGYEHRGDVIKELRARLAELEAEPAYEGSLDGSVSPNWLAMQDIAASGGDQGAAQLRELQAMDLSGFTDFNEMIEALNKALKGRR